MARGGQITIETLLNVREAVHFCYLREHTIATLRKALGVAQEHTVRRWLLLAEDLGVAFRVLGDRTNQRRFWTVWDRREVARIDEIIDERQAAVGCRKG